MAKKSKLKTPDWILKGDVKPPTQKKKPDRTFKIRKCPSCDSNDVSVVLTGEENKAVKDWQCKQCGWIGKDISYDELTEDEFLKRTEIEDNEKGEKVV